MKIDWHERLYPGIAAWYKEHDARMAAMTPAERKAYDQEMERRRAEYQKIEDWLNWCAKNNTHPKGAL